MTEFDFVVVGVFLFVFFFWGGGGRVSLCSSDWPGTQYADQAGLEPGLKADALTLSLGFSVKIII